MDTFLQGTVCQTEREVFNNTCLHIGVKVHGDHVNDVLNLKLDNSLKILFPGIQAVTRKRSTNISKGRIKHVQLSEPLLMDTSVLWTVHLVRKRPK